jgi:hypothetical protein
MNIYQGVTGASVLHYEEDVEICMNFPQGGCREPHQEIG